jgi:hypothetical protein
LLDAVAEAEALPSTLHKRVKFSPADVTQRARQDFLAPAQRGDANRFNPQGVRDEAERIVARIEDARDLSAMWSESEAAPAPEPDLFGGTPAPAPAPAPVEVQWTEITALNRDPGGLRITSRGDENVYIDVPTVGSVFVKVPDPDTFTLDDPGAQFREPEPAAADLSPIPYAYNMPPGLVQPAQIDPDTYYMLWEQSPSGGWVQERSYRGQYILDALADELRQKATTSRPMIVMPMGDVPEPVRAAAPTRPASKPDDGFVARGWPMGWDGSSNHARRLLIARVAHPSDLNESRLETAMESETPEKRLAIVGYLDEIARQGVVTNEIVDLAERIKADYDAEDAEYEVPAAPAETGMGLNPFRGPGAPALLTVNGKPVRLPVRGYAVASFEGEVREIARDSLYHAEMDKEEVQSYFLLDALFDYGKSTLSLPADPALGRLLLDGLNNLSNAEYATGEEADDPASRRHARAASQGLTTLVLKATEAYVKAGVDLDKPAGPPPGSLTARAEALADKIEALYADAEAATRFPALRVGVTSKVIDADTLRKRIPVISKADLEGFEADYKSGVKALVALREREALRAGEAERALPRMTLPVPDKPAEREMTPLQKQIAKMLGYKRNPRRLRRNPALSDRGRAAITRILTEQKGANAREADRVLTELDAVAIALDAEPAEFVRRVLAALDAVLSTVRQAEQDEIDRLLEEAAGGAAPAPAAPAPAPAPEPEEADWRPSSPINQHFIAGKVAAALGQRGWRAEAKGEGSPTTPGQMTVNAHGFGDSSVSSAQSVLINRDSEFGFTLTVRATNVTRYITEPEALDNVVDAFASFVADTLTDDNLYPTSEAAREAELEAMLAPSAPAPAPAPAPQPAPAPSSAVPPYDIEDRTRKSGAPYVVLIPLERVSKAEWKRRIESAKRAGSQRGWKGAWGNKRGGYPFDTREQAEAWWFSYFGAEAPEAAPAAPGVVQVMSLVSDALYRWYTEAAKESDDKGVLAVAGYGFDGAEKSVGFRFQRTAPGDDAFMVITPTGDLRSGLTRTLDEAKATADDLAETIERSLREANVYPTSAAAREAELEAMLGGPAATTPEPEPEPDVVIFRFPSLNKMNTLTGYLGQPDEDWKQTRGVVEEVVNVTPARWMEIAANLLDDIPEIAKTGGTGSTYDPYPGDDSKGWGDFTEKQRQRWMDESYRQVTAIFAPGKPPIYTDPQGYNYARYVGFLPSAGQSVEDIRALYRKALGVGPEPAPTPAPAGPSASTLVTEAVTEAVGAAQGSGRRVVPTGATSPSPSPAAPPAPAPADDKAAALAALFADV